MIYWILFILGTFFLTLGISSNFYLLIFRRFNSYYKFYKFVFVIIGLFFVVYGLYIESIININ